MPLNSIVSYLAQPIIGIGVLFLGLVTGLAEVITGEWQPIVNLGIAGLGLTWLALQVMPRLVAIEASINRMVRMTGLSILAMKSVSPALKEQAREIIVETERAETKRKKGRHEI